MNPAPNSYHQAVLSRIYSQFAEQIDKPGKGYVFFAPIDVQLDEFNIVKPDLVVILQDRKSILSKKNIQGTPSLVVEIVSPGNSKHDRQLKMKLYEKFEIPEYWIIDPDAESVETYYLEPHRYVLQKDSGDIVAVKSLPTVKIDTSSLFKFDF